MAITTCEVKATVTTADGTPIENATVMAQLNDVVIYNGIIIPEVIVKNTDAAGIALLDLWPNELQTIPETFYQVTIVTPNQEYSRLNIKVRNVDKSNLYELVSDISNIKPTHRLSILDPNGDIALPNNAMMIGSERSSAVQSYGIKKAVINQPYAWGAGEMSLTSDGTKTVISHHTSLPNSQESFLIGEGFLWHAKGTEAAVKIFTEDNPPDASQITNLPDLAALAIEIPKAKKWAINPENVAVEPGKYSSYHYAQKAADIARQMAVDKTAIDAMNIPQVGVDVQAAASQVSGDKVAVRADRQAVIALKQDTDVAKNKAEKAAVSAQSAAAGAIQDGGVFTPTVEKPYPDTPVLSTIWWVLLPKGLKFTYTDGDLVGTDYATVENGSEIHYDAVTAKFYSTGDDKTVDLSSLNFLDPNGGTMTGPFTWFGSGGALLQYRTSTGIKEVFGVHALDGDQTVNVGDADMSLHLAAKEAPSIEVNGKDDSLVLLSQLYELTRRLLEGGGLISVGDDPKTKKAGLYYVNGKFTGAPTLPSNNYVGLMEIKKGFNSTNGSLIEYHTVDGVYELLEFTGGWSSTWIEPSSGGGGIASLGGALDSDLELGVHGIKYNRSYILVVSNGKLILGDQDMQMEVVSKLVPKWRRDSRHTYDFFTQANPPQSSQIGGIWVGCLIEVVIEDGQQVGVPAGGRYHQCDGSTIPPFYYGLKQMFPSGNYPNIPVADIAPNIKKYTFIKVKD
jgi:hypothetical protein